VGKKEEGFYLKTMRECPKSIGKLSAFMGNAGILMRAYIYARLLGREGLKRVSEYSTLNANYLLARLKAAGFTPAFPKRRATHEFILTLEPEHHSMGLTALDVSKTLLDYGMHAPTMYFPLMVPECLLVEPTETEAKRELDAFVSALVEIRRRAEKDIQDLKNAPYTMPVSRLDDVKAAKELNLAWKAS
ncbi:MAG: aminomethyl-transferring glycine dehydrogenase subunit GcvPB, partial [Gammaproteobacteria bacterium]|nr:aminomethyl-transferring glycine dehydrogenase subunit GcvPB [Gammaproteobacteria bacterium]